jgi:hypothetical protein
MRRWLKNRCALASLEATRGGSAGFDRFPGLAGAFGTKTRAGQVETIQVAEADGAGFGADRRRSFSPKVPGVLDRLSLPYSTLHLS